MTKRTPKKKVNRKAEVDTETPRVARWKLPKEATSYLQKLHDTDEVLSVTVTEDMKFIEITLENNEDAEG